MTLTEIRSHSQVGRFAAMNGLASISKRDRVATHDVMSVAVICLGVVAVKCIPAIAALTTELVCVLNFLGRVAHWQSDS